MKKYLKVSLLIITDIILINLAFVIALLLRFDFNVDSQEFGRYLIIYQNWAFFITVIKIAVNVFMGLYNSLWEYASIDEVFRVSIAAAFNFAAIILLMYYMQQMLPRSAYLIVFILDVLFLGGARIFYRILRRLRSSENGKALAERMNLRNFIAPTEKYSRVLVIGAGQAGAAIIRELRDNPRFGKQVIGVIDDDPTKIGTRIMGKKVLGNRDSIPRIVRKRDINEIIIAIPSASRKEIQAIASICEKTGCKTSILPGYIDLIDGKVSIAKLREINVEDLLGREPVTLDIEGVSRYIKGKVVLVTGGGGSIGSELCRQLADLIPEKLVGMDIYENNLYELSIEIQSTHPELKFVPVIASIRYRESLSRVFEEYRPDVVFHAAAHKHVPLMESNPQEALLNNIVGTKNVIDLSDEWGVEKFILISTDKAVNPTNVMGATKRVAEMLMQDKSHKSRTSYSAVRFGNVLGSNGSVVPLFQKQIEQGGPVTVTHPEVTRYFMTIPEAVQLVIQTGAMAAGGEIFVLDMGEPVKIKDLAESLIRLSGYTPYTDIDIVYTGLRPGEKLYEELLMEEEGLKETSHGSIFIGKPVPPTPALAEILNRGKNALEEEVYNISQRSNEEIKQWLRTIVPTYKNGNGANGNGTPISAE
jgi:FlaA1/EpsC-like NDP-sugar epimerase